VKGRNKLGYLGGMLGKDRTEVWILFRCWHQSVSAERSWQSVTHCSPGKLKKRWDNPSVRS
jgi:hypothetical protein